MNRLIEFGAILACYLVLTLPVAGAANVNILYNGAVKDTAEYTPDNVVNQMISYKREPSDITWRDVKIHVTINSASLAQSVQKIYMYKCKTSSPSSCIQKTPETFGSYLDTEIAWKDISEPIGSSTYPQGGNLLFLVKLQDSEGMTSWVGIWNNIKRTSTKEFLFSRYEIPEIDVHASSIQYVEPIRAYVENFNMIPFEWVKKVVFRNTDSLFVLGASDEDLDASTPIFSAVEPQTNEIDSIGKTFHITFPVTASGIAVPVTLNDNPTFTCGDGNCQSNIGENEISCCYDCGCEEGYYCNSPSQQPSDGTCESESQISLDVMAVPAVDVTECNVPSELIIPIEIVNPPANLPESIRGKVNLGGTFYTITCTGEPPEYECPVRLEAERGCGKTTEVIEDNSIEVTINYNDGPTQVTRGLTEVFSQAKINYDCDCGEGKYCDTGTNTCESEEAITLGITYLTSYLDEYSPGDTINLKAKVFNPPTGMVLVSSSAYLNLTNGIVSPGSPTCTGPDEDYVYDCSIPFSITAYSNQYNYKFEPNTLIFQVTYNDGPVAKTKTLQTGFGPISIPSQLCGDGKVDVGETPETCCMDAGCNSVEEYCDEVKGCQLIENIGLRATAYPTEFDDCTIEHLLRITAEVLNAPAKLEPKDFVFITNGMVTPWNIDKADRTLGIYEFLVEIPPLEGGCELPYYALEDNSIRLTIEYFNGQTPIEKQLNTTISNIYIEPMFHPGNGICEVNILENASNSCVDCPCDQDENYGEDYYCSYDPETFYGSCEPKSDMELVIDSPTSPVTYDSCEITNNLMILGHVENAPAQGFKIVSKYASMNGESVNVRRCKEVENHNETLFEMNCTISIPPEPECTQGMTYPYANNTFSIVVTYPDGKGRTALQTLTSPFADVSITQGIRTMYDIMEDTSTQMEASLDRIMSIADKMVDAMTQCMEMMIYAMIISVALTIGMTIYGGTGGDDRSWGENFDSERAKEFGDIGQGLGKTVTEAIDAMCKTIQAKMEIAMDMEEVKMAQISMHACLEIVQHQMDTGSCRGQESSCFNDMRSCIRDGMSDIKSAMRDARRTMDRLEDEYEDVFDALEDMTDSDIDFKGNFRIYWGRQGSLAHRIREGGNVCDVSGRKGLTTITTECYETFVQFKTYGQLEDCSSSRLMVYSETVDDSYRVNEAILYSNILEQGDNKLTLFCDEDDDGYKDSSDDKVGSFTITLLEGDEEDCECDEVKKDEEETKITIDQPKDGANITVGSSVTVSGTAPTSTTQVDVKIGNFVPEVTISNGNWETKEKWTPENTGDVNICAKYRDSAGWHPVECNMIDVVPKSEEEEEEEEEPSGPPSTVCGEGNSPIEGLSNEDWVFYFSCQDVPAEGYDWEDYDIVDSASEVSFDDDLTDHTCTCIRGFCTEEEEDYNIFCCEF